MVSYYRINVSKDGIYLFSTEQGQLASRLRAMEVFEILREKFPIDEGYSVTCTHGRAKERKLILIEKPTKYEWRLCKI